MNGHLEATKLLVEAGAAVEERNRAGATPAAEAESAGHVEVGEWLFVVVGGDGEAEEDEGTGKAEKREKVGAEEVGFKMGEVNVGDQKGGES
jgi:hypothetical protein